ncbi:MAG: hypothetical protein Q4B94_05665 [Pseudomonadota bacterium]|nr:hypothetical protein [Pseudomonadota bacterium]
MLADTVSPRQMRFTLLALILAMVMTRFHEIGKLLHLYDASMAVFFLGGLLLARHRLFLAFVLLGISIDFTAISLRGESFFDAYCVTPSYGFLQVAYAVLWYGGRAVSGKLATQAAALLGVAAVGVLASTVAFIISNGAFYWLGGRYAEPHMAEYLARAWRWGPSYVMTASAYISAGLLLWRVFGKHGAQGRMARV